MLERSKCSFAQQSLEYLGHIIGAEEVSAELTKVLAVADWPTPFDVKQLRGFLGLSGYSTKIIRNYALFSKPLTDLLKKHVPFVWTSQHQQCFDILNHALLTAPVLALPDFSKSFQIETDVSAFGIGPVLMQDHHPIAYMSKT